MMKYRNVLLCMLLSGLACGYTSLAQADDGDCQIMSSLKQVDYGRFRREEMRQSSTEYTGKSYSGYASVTREIQVAVECPDARRIRLYVDGPSRQGLAYRFSDNGIMRFEVKDARVDGTAVQLTAINRGAVSVQGGAAQVTLSPDKAVAAVNGQEVAGRQWVATLSITTYLSDNAFRVSNTSDLSENVTLSFDSLAAL